MKHSNIIYLLYFFSISLTSLNCSDKLDNHEIESDKDHIIDTYDKTNGFVLSYTGDYKKTLCFVEKDNSDDLMFNLVTLFAPNINYDESTKKPYIFTNEAVTAQLEDSETIESLKRKGVKVIATILGNHQNAGWSCFDNEEDALDFALKLKDFVTKYNLDGIDIDDEYSICPDSENSLAMVTYFIKQQMPEKLLTMALVETNGFDGEFRGTRLVDNLDYAWDALYQANNYSTAISTLSRYVSTLGFKKSQLSVLLSKKYGNGNAQSNSEVALAIKQRGYGGIGFFSDQETYTVDYLGPIYDSYTGKEVIESLNCN